METLSGFFVRMRERTRKRPVLTGGELEAKGLDWIKAETKRRHYGVPANSRKAGIEEWIQHFLLLQETDKPLSLREVAKRSGADVRMIWKLEHGYRVGAETVKMAFIKGLGLPANGADVKQALTLWAADRTTPEAGEALKTLAGWREGDLLEDDQDYLRRVIPLLLKLDEKAREDLLVMLDDPGTMEAVAALAKLARRRRKEDGDYSIQAG